MNNNETVIDKIYYLNNKFSYHDDELERLITIANKFTMRCDLLLKKERLSSYIANLYSYSRDENDKKFLQDLYSKTHI